MFFGDEATAHVEQVFIASPVFLCVLVRFPVMAVDGKMHRAERRVHGALQQRLATNGVSPEVESLAHERKLWKTAFSPALEKVNPLDNNC